MSFNGLAEGRDRIQKGRPRAPNPVTSPAADMPLGTVAVRSFRFAYLAVRGNLGVKKMPFVRGHRRIQRGRIRWVRPYVRRR